jgi:hypothetical protein
VRAISAGQKINLEVVGGFGIVAASFLFCFALLQPTSFANLPVAPPKNAVLG